MRALIDRVINKISYYIEARIIDRGSVEDGTSLYKRIRFTALIAVKYGNIPKLKEALLGLKLAMIHIDDDTYPNEDTLLHIAAKGKSVEVVKLLLDSGANVNVRHIHSYRTPFECATSPEVKALLRLYGAKSYLDLIRDNIYAIKR